MLLISCYVPVLISGRRRPEDGDGPRDVVDLAAPLHELRGSEIQLVPRLALHGRDEFLRGGEGTVD